MKAIVNFIIRSDDMIDLDNTLINAMHTTANIYIGIWYTEKK